METYLSERLNKMFEIFNNYQAIKRISIEVMKARDLAVKEMALTPALDNAYCEYLKKQNSLQKSMYGEAMKAYQYKNQKDCRFIENPEEFNKVVKSIFKITFNF